MKTMRLSGAAFVGNADTFRFGKTFTMTKKGGMASIQSARSAITTTEPGAHAIVDIMKHRLPAKDADEKDQ